MRDEFGVPHIAASNEHDLMYAVGFVHAQDRLWQMEFGRRAALGRLSEVLKEATIKFDRLFRTLDFRGLADSLLTYMHPTSRRLLEDYAEGVNAYITTQRGKYPIEFDMLNIDPEPWKPQHSLMLSRLMAWELCFAWWVELAYDDIQARVGPRKFSEIALYPDHQGTTASGATTPGTLARELCDLRSVLRIYREEFHIGAMGAGSNAWVVDSSHSLGGFPMLANDPHLRVTVPSQWYEVHLHAPGWNVGGVTIPGIPLVVIGHNDSLAWGFTNAMLDDADFYIEKPDTNDPAKYIYKNSSVPMNVRDETIMIGSADSIVMTVRRTHHGPVINDVTAGTVLRPDGRAAVRQHPVSLRWTGFGMSDEVLGFYRINRAANAREFEEGIRELATPAQCAVYADVEGNIGCWLAGRVPLRGNNNPALPLDGSTGSTEWSGFVPFGELPRRWNPADGRIVCANQPPVDKSYPYYLSYLWAPPYRADRIDSLLRSTEKLTIEDFRQFQSDVVSFHSRDVVPYLLNAFTGDSTLDAKTQSALVYLRNWDFRCTQEDVATTVFNVFFVHLLRNTFLDEMGDDLFNDFAYFTYIPYRSMNKMLPVDTAMWFDDTATPRREVRDDIIRRSLHEAIHELEGSLGGEMKNWRWGAIHQAYFAHPFGARKPLDMIFDIGPFPLGGSLSTINKADFKIGSPYNLFSGASMRQLVDLAEPQTAYMVNTLGQSGQALQDHYQDQVALWLKGGNRETTLDLQKLRSVPLDVLTLVPLHP